MPINIQVTRLIASKQYKDASLIRVSLEYSFYTYRKFVIMLKLVQKSVRASVSLLRILHLN
jgi:hypothetical protein